MCIGLFGMVSTVRSRELALVKQLRIGARGSS